MMLFALLLQFMLLTSTQAKVGYFWHITDIHYDDKYFVGGNPKRNCWNNFNGMTGHRKPAGKFGDYNCDSPWSLVESAAKAMKKHGDNIEFVLWTGDGVSHARSISTEHQLEVLNNLTDLLRHTFSSQFVFPVLGHEDPNPGNGEESSEESRQWYKKVSALWKHWLPTEALQTFDIGGYYSFEQKANKLRVIALNTNLCTKDTDSAGQWEWLESVLNQSRRSKETVYLVGHIPPGMDERQSGTYLAPQAAFIERSNSKYLNLVRKYSDIIVGQFFGHLHSDTFRVIYSDGGRRPVSWMFIAPALTPRRTTSGANNPGLRLYKFDTDSGMVIDYTQYYLDLPQANQKGHADWQIEYEFKSYYDVNDISSASLHHLAESFVASDSESLFPKYYRANSVRYHTSSSTCDPSCAYTHYCAITRVDYERFRGCLETEPSAFASRGGQRQISGDIFCSVVLVLLSLHAR